MARLRRNRRGVYRPEQTAEQKAMSSYIAMLKSVGGSYWSNDDADKRRVYFEHGVESFFYDCITGRWSDDVLGAQVISGIDPGEQVSAPAAMTDEQVAHHYSDIKRKNEQQNAENAVKMAFIGAPALKGSEKQIAWAETIRAKIIDRMECAGFSHEKIAEVLSDKEAKKASFWIDNREVIAREDNEGDGVDMLLDYLRKPII